METTIKHVFDDDMWNVVQHSKNYLNDDPNKYDSTNYIITDKSKNIKYTIVDHGAWYTSNLGGTVEKTLNLNDMEKIAVPICAIHNYVCGEIAGSVIRPETFVNDYLKVHKRITYNESTKKYDRLSDLWGVCGVDELLDDDGKLIIQFGVVNGFFECGHSKISSLEGCPEYVGAFFSCAYSKNLTSLVGGPKIVKGYYFCNDTNITSFEGCAEHIGVGIQCWRTKATSLEGIPKDCSYISHRLEEDEPKIEITDEYMDEIIGAHLDKSKIVERRYKSLFKRHTIEKDWHTFPKGEYDFKNYEYRIQVVGELKNNEKE